MNVDPTQVFQETVRANIAGLKADGDVQALSRIWLREIARHKYAYNFTCMGRPLIQFPQDMVAVQEIIWMVRPDLIIETGIAHGGSLVMSASLLAMLDYSDATAESRAHLDLGKPRRRVLGIDVDIRAHNRAAIEAHPMASCIDMIEGSSTDSGVIAKVVDIARSHERILVMLDSNHTHEHVLAELRAYAPLVTNGSYCIVFDTLIEDMPDDFFNDRPWGKGDNPKTAVDCYLLEDSGLEVDRDLEAKLLITAAPGGFLRRRCSAAAG